MSNNSQVHQWYLHHQRCKYRLSTTSGLLKDQRVSTSALSHPCSLTRAHSPAGSAVSPKFHHNAEDLLHVAQGANS